jgi:hypothetical protein
MAMTKGDYDLVHNGCYDIEKKLQTEIGRLAAQLDTATKELVLQSNERNKAQARGAQTEAALTRLAYLETESGRELKAYARAALAALAEGDAHCCPECALKAKVIAPAGEGDADADTN